MDYPNSFLGNLSTIGHYIIPSISTIYFLLFLMLFISFRLAPESGRLYEQKKHKGNQLPQEELHLDF